MIQGVRAETVAFVDYQQAAALLRVPGWSWLGLPGQFFTRHVRLDGTPPRECRLRVTRVQLHKQALACTLQLESREGAPGTPLIRGDLDLTAAPNGKAATRCLLSLHGLAARNLADSGGPASADATRHLANEYARSLLEQVARSLEREARSAVSAEAAGR
jgi:hypothetical protein